MTTNPGADIWDAFTAAGRGAGHAECPQGPPPISSIRRKGRPSYLSRLVRLGLVYLEGAIDFPAFVRPSHETAKLGGDNPDNLYLSATIAGDRTYRLTGNVGSVAYLSIGSKANRAIDGTMASTGELSERIPRRCERRFRHHRQPDRSAGWQRMVAVGGGFEHPASAARPLSTGAVKCRRRSLSNGSAMARRCRTRSTLRR